MKHPWGRPAFYTTKEELEKELDRYFEETPISEWTVTWLALFLWFTTRQWLLNYECKPEFVDPIKKAKCMVEYSYELDLKAKGNTWTIFALKNFDWKDKFENENKNDNTNVDVSSELSPEQKQAIASRWTK